MKRYINIFFVISGIFLLFSCSLDRQYLNGPNAATFPATKSEVESGVFAAYKGLTLIDASSTPFPGIQDNATDIGVSRINVANYNYQQQSKIAIDNSWIKKVYSNIFKTVARANLVLDGMKKWGDVTSDESLGSIMSNEEYNMYKAEALLVRSFMLEWGCQLYGDFPYIDYTLGLDDKYTRQPRRKVIEKILQDDLKDELLDFLPLRHDKNKYGSARLGRVGAYGLKARICLNWGFYEDAAKYANKAIELAKEAGYKLENYNIEFCGGSHVEGEPSATNLFGIQGHKNSDEWIWTIQFNSSINSNQHNAGYYAAPRPAGGCSYFGPTQAFIDAFQCIDGKSIVESELFDYKNPWKNRDPRLDLFCVRPGSRVFGFQFETDPSVTKIINYNEGGILVTNSEAYGTKSEYGANGAKGPAGYLWRKYVDISEYQLNGNSFGSKSKCVLNYPLMRLSELYLIRAEANIELNIDLIKAKSDIELIRARAKMPELTSVNQSDLRKALRYERMIELCNEGFRWFDLRRWNIAEDAISGTLYAPSFNGELSNAKPIINENYCVKYGIETFDGEKNNLRSFLEMRYDSLKDDLWPIPLDEMIGNPLIQQNPGYGSDQNE